MFPKIIGSFLPRNGVESVSQSITLRKNFRQGPDSPWLDPTMTTTFFCSQLSRHGKIRDGLKNLQANP
jgi:hypothetical protein